MDKNKSLLSIRYGDEIANQIIIIKPPKLGGGIDIDKFRSILYEEHKWISPDSSEVFSENELATTLNEDIKLHEIMLYANLCLGPSDNCSTCDASLWSYSPDKSENESKYFSKVANLTIRNIVAAIAGSRMDLSNKEFYGIRENKSVKLIPGRINNYDFANKRHAGIIASALQQSIQYLGDVEIYDESGTVVDLSFTDNKLSESMQITSVKLIDKLASELIKLKPLAVFSGNENQLPVVEQLKWAKRISGQLLYAASI